MTVIETERLVLRPYVESDAPRVLDIHSRLDVIRWLGDPPFVPMADLDEARRWIATWQSREPDPLFRARAIEVRETGVVAGTVLVAPLERVDGGFVGEREVGWHLHPDAIGHGYATEAARAIIDAIFAAGLDELWCGMYPDNHASAAVARRLGLPEQGIVDDPWYQGDSLLFRVARQEWTTR